MLLEMLKWLLFTRLFSKHCEQLSKEYSEKYERGKEIHSSGRKARDEYEEACVLYYLEVTQEVSRQVEDELKTEDDLDTISSQKTRWFFQACVLVGFPTESCNSESIANSIVALFLHMMVKSKELQSTSPEFPNFGNLLKAYEALTSVFNIPIIQTVLYHFMENNVLNILNICMRKESGYPRIQCVFSDFLQVDSFEFTLMKIQALLQAAQTEKNSNSLRNILSELVDKLNHVKVSLKISAAQKLECLCKIVPLLIKLLGSSIWQEHVAFIIHEKIRLIFDILYGFVEDIVRTMSDVQYSEILQRIFPADSSSIPCLKDLPQFLLKLSDKYGQIQKI